VTSRTAAVPASAKMPQHLIPNRDETDSPPAPPVMPNVVPTVMTSVTFDRNVDCQTVIPNRLWCPTVIPRRHVDGGRHPRLCRHSSHAGIASLRPPSRYRRVNPKGGRHRETPFGVCHHAPHFQVARRDAAIRATGEPDGRLQSISGRLPRPVQPSRQVLPALSSEYHLVASLLDNPNQSRRIAKYGRHALPSDPKSRGERRLL